MELFGGSETGSGKLYSFSFLKIMRGSSGTSNRNLFLNFAKKNFRFGLACFLEPNYTTSKKKEFNESIVKYYQYH